MRAAWVAGTVRARALASRRAGRAVAREIAGQRDAGEAVRMLAETPYGHDVREGQDLRTARHAVVATMLWHLRVLVGWLPSQGMATLRTLAGWFEIAGVDARLFGGPSYEPGTLAPGWPALRDAPDLRAALTASVWGDPGGDDPRAIQLGMRISWARRVADVSEDAMPWAAGALALLVARERFLERRDLPPPPELLGTKTARATGVAELAHLLPDHAAWPLRGIDGEHELWAAERSWWARLEHDGAGLLAARGHGPAPVVGAVALLAADAHRVVAALESAARGGTPEAFDALVA